MIKKLKRRFITIYMIILSCFFITILAGIYFIVYHSEVTQSEQIMQMALQNNIKLDKGNIPNNSPPKKVIDFKEDTITMTSAGDINYQEDTITYYNKYNDYNSNIEYYRNDFENTFKNDNEKYRPQYDDDHYFFDDQDHYDDHYNDFDDDYNDFDDDYNDDFDLLPPTTTNDEYMPPAPNDWNEPEFKFSHRQDFSSNNDTTNEPIVSSSFERTPESIIEEQQVETVSNTTDIPQTDTQQTINDTMETTDSETLETSIKDTTTSITSETSKESSNNTSTETSINTIDTPIEPPYHESRITQYEGNLARNTICVKVTQDYEIEKISYQYFESGDNLSFEQSVKEIIESGVMSGKTEIDNIKFRYCVFQPDDKSGYDIVFLDRAIELSTLNRLLIIFIGIGSIGLIILFGLSWLLASWAITPIADAWDKQKQFIADASHELKTPLTVIATNTDVILANYEDTVQNQAKWLNYIKSETSRMSKLVADLLYIAKTDVNEVAMVMNEFNLSHTVLGICLVFESVAFEKGKLLDTNIDEEISFKGDEDRIKQLITILIDNAIVHSNDNADIMVTLKRDNKDKIKLSVSNTNGEDIPKGMENRLFERFFRVDKARNRSNGSHGLGLNIAQSIVKNHNGTITVTSTPNHLVTFTITL